MRQQIVYLTAFLLIFTGSLFAEHPETETQSQTNWSSAPAMTVDPIIGTNAVCAGDTAGYSCTGTDDDTKQTRSRSRTELPIYDEECPPNLIGWYWPDWPDWPDWTTNSVGDGVHVIKWEASAGSISDGSFTAPTEGGQYVTITATLDDEAPAVDEGSRDDGPVQKTKEVAIVKVATVTVDKLAVAIDDEVTFTATTDPAGYEDLIEWNGGGDPATGSGNTFITKWTDPGEYTVTASCGTSSKSTNVIAVKVEIAEFDRVPPGKTNQVNVAVIPSPLPEGYSISLECEPDEGTTGSATVSPGSITSSTNVFITGGDQSWGASGPAPKNIRLKAKLGGSDCGEGEGFTVCAHVTSITSQFDHEWGLPTAYGFVVKIAFTSDSDNSEDLDKVYIREKVNRHASLIPDPPFIIPSDWSDSDVLIPDKYGYACPNCPGDSHTWGNDQLRMNNLTCGSFTVDQTWQWECRRCSSGWHDDTHYTIIRTVAGANDNWTLTINQPGVHSGTYNIIP